MQAYTFTCRDDDVVVTEPKAYVGSETEAVACARNLAQNHQSVELWQGDRLVQRFIDGDVDPLA